MNLFDNQNDFGSETINISSDFLANEDDDQVNFQFSSININLSFLQLYKYSQLIREELHKDEVINCFKEKLQKYQIAENIKEESITIFLKILKEENVKITNDQYFDLFKLSEIFKVNSLINFLKKYARRHSENIDFIISLILKQNESNKEKNDSFIIYDQISSEMEACLSENINKCIQNDKFQKLPISIIYRIFEKSSPEKINHDMLYEFISKSIKNRHVLFRFIDLQKLSNDKFDEMYELYVSQNDPESKIYFQFLPTNLRFFKDFKDRQKSLEDEIKELREINKNLQSQKDKAVDDNSQLQSQLNHFKTSQESLEDEVKRVAEINKNLQIQQDKAVADNKQLISQLNQLQNEIKASNKQRDEYQSQCQKLLEKTQMQGTEYKYSANFDGIINSLNKKCGGNCSEEGVINVTCSKVQHYAATNLTNYNNRIKNVWIDNQLNGFFEFDFRDKKVIITDYEFETPNSGKDNGYPKNWTVECSNDKNDWFVIDRITNDEHLHGPLKHHVFKAKNPIGTPCRYVRIYQRGRSHSSSEDYYFGLLKVEFYGQLC